MENTQKLLDVLESLDTEQDGNWTQSGLPQLQVVNTQLDQPLTRKEITDAAPEFTRETLRAKQAAATPPTGPETGMESAEPVGLTMVEQIEAKLAELNTELLEVSRVMSKARDKQRVLEIQVHNLGKQRDALVKPNADNQSAIQAFIKSQAEGRARVAERRRMVTDAGLGDLLKSGGQAPIDEAMARRNTRGTQRPVRENMNGDKT